MATTIPSAALVSVAPVFTNAERLALAGFLAEYSGLTRQAYELDLRQFASWCQQHQLQLFRARRADIEFFARDLEARGRARATITRRLCTVAGFYRCRRRGAARSLTRRACAAAAAGLRVARHRSGPQRARCHARYCQSWPTTRACADLLARAERATGLRSHRRQHRSARHRARLPHLGDHLQGQQGHHHPARTAHHPGDRPGHR
jgi:integrase family protein with SAM-like domain